MTSSCMAMMMMVNELRIFDEWGQQRLHDVLGDGREWIIPTILGYAVDIYLGVGWLGDDREWGDGVYVT